MTELKRRVVLLLITVVISASMLFTGRKVFRNEKPAAFLHYSSGMSVIRLTGAFPDPGVYRFPEHTKVRAVIKLTAPSFGGNAVKGDMLERELFNGDILDAAAFDKQHIEININRMKARERVLLGIPLDPDEMDADDWDSLPGIGPELAKTIVDYRQKYGDFGSISSLLKVPGIGEKKLNSIRMYFKPS